MATPAQYGILAVMFVVVGVGLGVTMMKSDFNAANNEVTNNTASSVEAAPSQQNDLNADVDEDASAQSSLAIYQQAANAVADGTVRLGLPGYRVKTDPNSIGIVTELPTAQKCGIIEISNDFDPDSKMPVPDLSGASRYALCITGVKATYLPKPAA